MTSRPYLTDAEILEIVEPLTQRAAICRWFTLKGFTIKVRPNGMPLISRSQFEAAMAGGQTSAKSGLNDDGTQSTPNVVAFMQRFGQGSAVNGKKAQRQSTRPS